MNIVVNVERTEDQEPLRQAVESVVSQVSTDLDLSILEQIFIPNDFGEELIAFQKKKDLPEGFTDTEHGRAFGKTLYYFVDSELKSTIFIDHRIVYGIFSDELRQRSVNLIHHELCHVHDETVKSKDVGIELVNERGHDLKTALLVHADSIWSEYIAVKLSYSTVDFKGEDPFGIDYFRDLIKIVKDDVDKAIESSKSNQDWFALFGTTQMSVNILLRITASLLANMHTLDREDVSNVLSEYVDKTYLKEIWGDLNDELKRLHQWHGQWGTAHFLDNMANIVYRVWNALNVEVEDLGEDGIYVGVIEN